MDIEYLQTLRYKLQKRFRRLNSARWEVYHQTLKHFWQSLRNEPVCAAAVSGLLARVPSAPNTAKRITEGEGLLGQDELEAAAIGYLVIAHCVESDDGMCEANVAGAYSHESKYEANQKYFTELFVEPVYEYIDEQLDDRGAILGLLRKFKEKAEWFQRELLFNLWDTQQERGEKRLALHLFEYLHDQGLRFYIEPTSASGEADMVISQEGTDRLIADAKVFHPDKGKGKSYIAAGFGQLYRYCVDFNEPIGYLIIFNTSPYDLKLALRDEALGASFARHNNKTIFFILIDIFPHQFSASKRGRLRSHELSEKELVESVESGHTA